MQDTRLRLPPTANHMRCSRAREGEGQQAEGVGQAELGVYLAYVGRCLPHVVVVSYIARGPFKGDNDNDNKKRKRFQDASSVDLGAGFSTCRVLDEYPMSAL